MSARPPRVPRDLVVRLQALTPRALLPALAALLLLAWSGLVATGDGLFAEHLFFVPILIAAARFGPRVGVGVGLLSALLAGPLTGAGTPLVWLGWSTTFALVGAVVGSVASARADELARDRELAERERELAAQRAALVQLVSHELRTPLTVIRGGVDTLLARPEALDPRFQPLVEATARSTVRLEQLIDVVLTAAEGLDQDPDVRHIDLDDPEQGSLDAQRRLRGRDPGPVALERLVHQAAASVDSELPDRVELDVEPSAEVLTVEPYLWLTLRCLLDNAAKFAPSDGPIEVRFRREGPDAVLSVRDHGPGLPDGFERIAFEPFTQADTSLSRAHAGSGMGLFTARRLVRRLGGEVSLDSSPSGLTVTVRLPQPAPVASPATVGT